MKIGGKYRLRDIGVYQWSKFFAELRVDGEATLARIARMAESLPDLVAKQLLRCEKAGLVHPVLDRLAEEICERVTSLASSLTDGRR